MKWVVRCADPFFVYYAETYEDACQMYASILHVERWPVEIVPESWTYEEIPYV